jgi:hypothetical protein
MIMPNKKAEFHPATVLLRSTAAVLYYLALYFNHKAHSLNCSLICDKMLVLISVYVNCMFMSFSVIDDDFLHELCS